MGRSGAMPKEYIRGQLSPDDISNDARISWDRLENGGIVQMAIFKNDGSYEEEHEKPQYMTLDRPAINDIIRILRRARDQAYGRDE
jgi:hypothetical protein